MRSVLGGAHPAPNDGEPPGLGEQLARAGPNLSVLFDVVALCEAGVKDGQGIVFGLDVRSRHHSSVLICARRSRMDQTGRRISA
jgi:hypothetical protein